MTQSAATAQFILLRQGQDRPFQSEGFTFRLFSFHALLLVICARLYITASSSVSSVKIPTSTSFALSVSTSIKFPPPLRGTGFLDTLPTEARPSFERQDRLWELFNNSMKPWGMTSYCSHTAHEPCDNARCATTLLLSAPLPSPQRNSEGGAPVQSAAAVGRTRGVIKAR